MHHAKPMVGSDGPDVKGACLGWKLAGLMLKLLSLFINAIVVTSPNTCQPRVGAHSCCPESGEHTISPSGSGYLALGLGGLSSQYQIFLSKATMKMAF